MGQKNIAIEDVVLADFEERSRSLGWNQGYVASAAILHFMAATPEDREKMLAALGEANRRAEAPAPAEVMNAADARPKNRRGRKHIAN